MSKMYKYFTSAIEHLTNNPTATQEQLADLVGISKTYLIQVMYHHDSSLTELRNEVAAAMIREINEYRAKAGIAPLKPQIPSLRYELYGEPRIKKNDGKQTD